jgi:hypothetical protein
MSFLVLLGLRRRWVPVRWCDVCEIQAPADHTCIDVDHPGTYRLINDLKAAAAADAPATTAQTPTT